MTAEEAKRAKIRSPLVYRRTAGWMFTSTLFPDRPLTTGSAMLIFDRAVKLAGLPHKGGIHSLRHSFAKQLLAAAGRYSSCSATVISPRPRATCTCAARSSVNSNACSKHSTAIR